jgi:FtsH-binding integral membrane protein
MRFTRIRDLAWAAVIAGVFTYLAVQLFYGDLPPLPTLAGVTLLVLAIVELVFGFSLRSRIRGERGSPPPQPLTAARAVALAKASSLLGAIMLGAWAGVLGYLLPLRAEIDDAGHDVPAGVVGMVCAAALIGAALWLEHCCRTPDNPDDDREQHSSSAR